MHKGLALDGSGRSAVLARVYAEGPRWWRHANAPDLSLLILIPKQAITTVPYAAST